MARSLFIRHCGGARVVEARGQRMARSRFIRSLLPLVGALALAAPLTAASADQITPSEPATAQQTTSEPTTTGSLPSSSSTTVAEGSATVTTPAGEGTASTTTQSAAPAPEVHAQAPQAGGVGRSTKAHVHAKPGKGSAAKPRVGGAGTQAGTPSHVRALAPSALTPLPPGALGLGASSVPSFFVSSFSIPPFLLPLFQAAGRTYGIPWQVLAAIDEVETDYGRDLSISSAGAEGWMQFLPSTWAMYGVDANGDGFADPYNPADAIFAAARYLHAAGGARHIDAAIFSYNHSQAYVASVLLRAQLLGGMPAQLVDAVSSLTEARFPVHAPAHFSDGFPTVGAAVPGRPAHTLVGTTIYSQPAAPAIAVQDGVVAAIGSSPTLGRYVVLRDDYGNVYTYGDLGSVAALYPVLAPHRQAVLSEGSARTRAAGASGRVALPPATAGAQPHSPFSAGAISSGLALGAAAELESLPLAPARPKPLPRVHRVRPAPAPRVFRAGPEDVFLHPLRVGAHVIAGTVIGHLVSTGEAAMLFQIRPAGVGAPQIDPKPLLDSWVQFQGSFVFRVTGRHRFPAAALPAKPKHRSAVQVALAPAPTLTPGQWLQLVARLGQIPDPVVAAKPSPAAIPDRPSAAPAGAASEGSGVHN
jgi:soluble lytic murein transglycosylase-like protein